MGGKRKSFHRYHWGNLSLANQYVPQVLIVGLDDSNHANGDSRGEILVGNFSQINDDSLVYCFPNRKRNDSYEEWLNLSLYRDYRFSLLTSELSRKAHTHLPFVAPIFVKSYLEQKPDVIVKKIKIYLNGDLPKTFRKKIREALIGFRGIENVVVDSFRTNSLEYPPVVYFADVLASQINRTRTTPAELFKDKKIISLDNYQPTF
jgi:hypothetical protein